MFSKDKRFSPKECDTIKYFIKKNRSKYKTNEKIIAACVKELGVMRTSVRRRLCLIDFEKRGYVRKEKNTIRKYLRDNRKKYPDDESLLVACMGDLGYKRLSVEARLRELRKNEVTEIGREIDTSIGVDMEEFKLKHDDISRLRYVIGQLKPGKLYIEMDFRDKIAKISTATFRSLAENTEFQANRGKVSGSTRRGLIYWGHADDIKKLKSEGVMV